MPKLKVGAQSPEFSSIDSQGNTIKLADFRGKRNVVLYFYPKDFTPGCTREACAFRDNFEEFKQLEAEVVGISSDTAESHRKFATEHRIPFQLLADTNKSIRKAYGAAGTLGILPGRVTYVIDKQGIIRHIFSSQLNAAKHVEEATRALQSLKQPQ